MSESLLATARQLAGANKTRPRQSDLTRSVSTSYYALFHAFAKDAADLFAGVRSGALDAAWTRVYRSLDHAAAKSACQQISAKSGLTSPSSHLAACADAFVTLQQARHDADYNPDHTLSQAQALAMVLIAENAIQSLKTAPRQVRRAFAIELLFRRRG